MVLFIVIKTMPTSCVFTNDNNVHILLPDYWLSHDFSFRDKHEVVFRRICTYLINNKIIKNNIIDLGAWIGDNSIPWAKNTPATIYAIDPSPENCSFIKQICDLNKIENIKIIQSAISHMDEVLVTNGDIGHCSFVNQNPNGRLTYAQARSLGSLYTSGEITTVGFIHLDVEGMEYSVLIGATELIDACRPIIAFEQHIDIEDFMLIATHLSSKNYSVFINDEILLNCRTDCRNFFAFPNKIMNSGFIEAIHESIGVETLLKR